MPSIWVEGQQIDLDDLSAQNTAPLTNNQAPVNRGQNRRVATARVPNTLISTPTPAGSTTVSATSGLQRFKTSSWNWTKSATNWLWNSARVVIAIICTIVWLYYGVVQQNAFYVTFPAAGMLYFVPLEFSFAKRIRTGLTIFWLLTWAVVFSALRLRG